MKFLIPGLLFAFVMAIACSCQSEQELEFKRYYTSGKVVYQSHCQNCHAANGEGLGTLIPPLTDAAYIKSNKSSLTCIINNGMQQPLLINKKSYYQKMPPSGLAPVEIAEVITYITNSFGNKLGTYTTGQVNHDLAACQ
ncbi:c-type cytochrome [Mucilaginibacter koreensis]